MTLRHLLIGWLGLLPAAWGSEEAYIPGTDAGWSTTTAAEAGADAGLLAEAVAYAGTANSNALVVLHRGRILVEQYWGGWNRSTLGKLNSATKPIVGALVDRLIADGVIASLDQPAATFLPEWRGVPGKSTITLRHQVTMTSGLEGGERNLVLGVLARNERAFATSLPLEHAPGTYWTYNNPAYRLLFYIVEEATRERFPAVLDRLVVGPTGMSGVRLLARVETVGGREVVNYQTIEANALSAARFGLLALRGGCWGSVQVLPRPALGAALAPSQDLNPSYGHLWWLNVGASRGGHQALFDGIRRAGPYFPGAPPDLAAAIGLDDQIIALVPSLDLVMVRLGSRPLGDSSEAVSPEQNRLFTGFARAFGYPGQMQEAQLQVTPRPGALRLGWVGWFGREYLVEQTADLAGPRWAAGPGPLIGDGLPVEVEVPFAGPATYLRLLWSR